MKQLWIRLSTRIDALSLRERMLVFVAVLASVVFAFYALVFDPISAEKETLAATIARQQSEMDQIEQQINILAKAAAADPDAANRLRVVALRSEAVRLSGELRSMQGSLVQPERIAPLLGTMLRSNGKLRLVALQTLPVTGLSEALPAGSGKAVAEPAPSPIPVEDAQPVARAGQSPSAAKDKVVEMAGPGLPELVYRHGVEITLQGRYADMVEYMAQLERMPVRLIWGKAKLDARGYPDVRLTLTLFTLSLDKEWMKL